MGRDAPLRSMTPTPDFRAMDMELDESCPQPGAGTPPRLEDKPVLPFAVPRSPDAATEAPPVLPSAPAPASGSLFASLRSRPRIAMALAATALLLVLGVALVSQLRGTPAAPGVTVAAAAATTATGTAVFDSNPSGVDVIVDGSKRGSTPLTLTLAVGEHTVELGAGPARRTLPVRIAANAVASHYVEMPAVPGVPAAPASTDGAGGRLEIISDPPGAQVRVDGVRRGVTPLTLAAVPVGEHAVSITQGEVVVNRTVRVARGSTATVLASTAAAGNAAGWVSVRAPFELKILDNDTLLGTTSAERIMLPAGTHVLKLANDALDFTSEVTVQVSPGRTTTTSVRIPDGVLSINALPWAEVWVDGRAVGTTPLANIAAPIGVREVIFRHPQLGERRQQVTVKAGAPARVGMDFSK